MKSPMISPTYPLVLAFAVLVPGCAHVTSPIAEPLGSDGYTNTSGSPQFFKEASFERIDLPSLLDPERKRIPKRSVANGGTSRSEGEDLDEAFAAFYSYSDAPLAEKRNRVLDRVLAASEQRCNVYKNYLRRVDTFQQTSTGILTTVFAGAGAIANGVSRVRTLSGLAGVTSGIGAELREGYFSNVATHIIVPGIDLARGDIMREIAQKRDQPIATYTVEGALQDAARFHGACSLNTGLERSGVAIKEVKNPGIAMLNSVLAQANLSNKLSRRISDETIKITDEDLRLVNITNGRAESISNSATPANGSLAARFIFNLSDAKSKLQSLSAVIDAQIASNKDKAKSDNGIDISAGVTGPKDCEDPTRIKEVARCKANLALNSAIRAGSGPSLNGLVATLDKRLQSGEVTDLADLDRKIAIASAEAESASSADKPEKVRNLEIARSLGESGLQPRISKLEALDGTITRIKSMLSTVMATTDLGPFLKNIELMVQ